MHDLFPGRYNLEWDVCTRKEIRKTNITSDYYVRYIGSKRTAVKRVYCAIRWDVELFLFLFSYSNKKTSYMPASTRLRIAINTIHLFYAMQYKIRRLLLRITRLGRLYCTCLFLFRSLYAPALIILPFARSLVHILFWESWTCELYSTRFRNFRETNSDDFKQWHNVFPIRENKTLDDWWKIEILE